MYKIQVGTFSWYSKTSKLSSLREKFSNFPKYSSLSLWMYTYFVRILYQQGTFVIWGVLLWRGSEALSLRGWLRWQHTLAAASAGSSKYVVSWICHRQSVLRSSTYQWHSFPYNSTCSCDTMLGCKSHISFFDWWPLDNFGDIFYCCKFTSFHWLSVNYSKN